MPTKLGESLPRLPQLAVEDFDVRRRTRNLMREICIRPEVRDRIDGFDQRERRNQWLRTDGRRGVEIAAQDIALLLGAGATRAEVMLIPVLLIELIDEMCHDGAGGDRLALELENIRLDAEEDALQGRALVEAESPQQMTDRAQALRREVASKLSLARSLEGTVRRRTLGLLSRTA